MKGQPNPLRALAILAGAMTLAIGVSQYGPAAWQAGKSRLAEITQPVVDTGKKIVQEVNAPYTPYASVLSNEVTRVESLLGEGKSLDAHFIADKLLSGMRRARGNDPSLDIEPLARRTLKVLEGTTLDFRVAYKESIEDFSYQ